ncbi:MULTISPECIES: DUF262 domain-containing protein [unclassified Paenibacillus]|uniref:DUF262 domain-containing protein n=1 Tax=unclassified Paenibacillus TaxID=185978 RepID=UPI001AE7ACF4|nr:MULTISPECIES: DUF262 domain-containing protein [unclassified Paenibacillus]MBP1157669.1 hypothetical protein [Paenibacillus sp. PvP091]MBP1171594.1 hypothetical protein [Paenibacillus sp. PvR098]MBP2437975.1 hypothetical protein [Paenibacillus sp. PvP052]
MVEEKEWFDEVDTSNDTEYNSIGEYDITSTPNDFNVITIFNFIEKGIFKIPAFQRNYVWDIKRASKLIESIILGLPIPQIFLYEESRNKFLVIDGQQRLLSIYYFIKQRFPRQDKRIELREIFDREGKIPESILANENYFTNFNLKLESSDPNKPSKFNKMNYATLEEYQTEFELKTIRNMVIKQNQPDNEHSSIFEIFNRLNTGGYNLKQQEIRASLFHSDFYNLLNRINLDKRWRRLLGKVSPDLHMADVEFLLRGFAMLYNGQEYKPSMNKFLNLFSGQSKSFTRDKIEEAEKVFSAFLAASEKLDSNIFHSLKGFSVSIFEAVFTAVGRPFVNNTKKDVEIFISEDKVNRLKGNTTFIDATQSNTVSKDNVSTRIALAQRILVNE